jgi:hypothetical protein
MVVVTCLLFNAPENKLNQSSSLLAQTTMPICITCASSVPFLYTVYESSHNLRLENCVSFITSSLKTHLPNQTRQIATHLQQTLMWNTIH